MFEFDTEVRKLGNSFGVIIPKRKLEMENIKEREMLHFIAIRKNKEIKKTFGLLKKWKTGQEIKDISRRELYD